jgi:hypothetical protein
MSWPHEQESGQRPRKRYWTTAPAKDDYALHVFDLASTDGWGNLLDLNGGASAPCIIAAPGKLHKTYMCCLVLRNDVAKPKRKNPEELQDEIRLHFKVYSDTPLPDLRITPKQYFASNYAKNVPNRQPLYNLRNSDPYYADTYHDYISFMTDGDAQVDELLIAFTAFLLGLNLTVYIQSEQQVPTVLSFIGIEQMWFPTLKVCIIFDGANFQLIDPPVEEQSVQAEELSSEPLCTLLSMGFSRKNAEQALLKASGNVELAIQHILSLPRVTLPDISDEILIPEMAANQLQQPSSRVELLTSIEKFHDACNSKASSESLPVSTEVNVSFNVVFLVAYRENIFGSMLLGKRHDVVKYRVVSFTMRNQLIVVYDGDIRELSSKSKKLAFFSQLYPVILHQDVISVRIARLN